MIVPGLAFSAQQPNPRVNNNARNVRSADSISSASIRRSATSVIARSANTNNRQARAVVTARPATVRTASVRSVRPVTSGTNVARTASKSSVVRSGLKQKTSGSNLARAGTARATAVFNDITKIGGGYSNCRDAYATCMDQFCALANDTYRRCFCSDKFADFRNLADKMDTALSMLADFQDNNLNAVDKTAAEVNAMYTATEGEKAIKRDTSASQKLLDSIGDILSGKSSPAPAKKTSASLGILDFSGFSSNNDDIFGGGVSLFGDSSAADMSTLEGKELYDSAAKQCVEITRESCGSDAMFNLARSAYSIMITQDCNAYEKNINAKKASVEETVRTAEKYLREARLEEYRSHNSASVNECLEKVEKEIRKPTACGENYEKCMDYTGQYINPTTGEPVYSQALFGLNSLIVLDGTADVLGANPGFDKWLEGKKMFAESALDTCRDDAEIVWYEFKRSALIQIAQAQDTMIQKVKDSCVETIKKCYDKQSGDLKSIDTTELQGTGAIVAVTARGMCYDRVQACAALYGDPNGCRYDDSTKKLDNNPDCTTKDGKPCKCGLQSLLTFVDTVDSVKVAEGCEAVLSDYAHELCPDSPEEKDKDGNVTKAKVPYGTCTTKPKAALRAAMNNRMEVFCAHDLVNADESNTLQESSAFNTNIMNQILKGIYDSLGIAFTKGCEEMGGNWVNANEVSRPALDMLVQEYYTKYYGTKVTEQGQYVSLNLDDYGWCINADKQNQCLDLGEEYTTGLDDEGQCQLTNEWYFDMCMDLLNGKWENNTCTIDNVTQESFGGVSSVDTKVENTAEDKNSESTNTTESKKKKKKIDASILEKMSNLSKKREMQQKEDAAVQLSKETDI